MERQLGFYWMIEWDGQQNMVWATDMGYIHLLDKQRTIRIKYCSDGLEHIVHEKYFRDNSIRATNSDLNPR